MGFLLPLALEGNSDLAVLAAGLPDLRRFGLGAVDFLGETFPSGAFGAGFGFFFLVDFFSAMPYREPK